MISLFIKGLIIGFAIAAPVGPIGLLCIHRSLTNGFKIGLMTGLGAALADGVYGCVAGFGLTAISSLLISHQLWIRGIGGLFLIYFGIKLFITKSTDKSKNKDSEKLSLHACATTFFLTLTNPMTILSFVAIFAGLGIGTVHPNFNHVAVMVFGVVLGSALWWVILSSSVAFFLHKRINTSSLKMINRLSGTIILLFGIFALTIFL
ncbi:MAG: LysE family transporter [Gammaproteobacteria bacterium]|nr:LysE family transporter [Gammaproteobacteria bacterium]